MSKILRNTSAQKLIIPGSKGGSGNRLLTDNNTPLKAGQVYAIYKSEIPILQRKIAQNPSFFKDNNITVIEILSDEDYMRLVRKEHEIRNFYFDPISAEEEAKKKAERLKSPILYQNATTGELVTPKEMSRLLEKDLVKDIKKI